MRMTFVCQSLTQLEAKYEKEAKDILSNCGIICFFGSRDDKIRKWLCEEQIGYTTFKVENKSYSKMVQTKANKDKEDYSLRLMNLIYCVKKMIIEEEAFS